MKNNGWDLFRPEIYDLKLMEYVDGVPTVVGDDKPWDECDNQSRRMLTQNSSPADRRMLSFETLVAQNVNPETKRGKFITLTKKAREDENV